MTLSSVIEDAWDDAVWTNSEILVITDKIFKYEITQDSEKETEVYFEEEINFFEVLTGRGQKYLETSTTIGRTIQYNYEVQVNYYREADTIGENYLAVRGVFETLIGVVIEELDDTWGSTVDYWRPQEDPIEITQVLIDNKKTWKGVQSYFATLTTEL